MRSIARLVRKCRRRLAPVAWCVIGATMTTLPPVADASASEPQMPRHQEHRFPLVFLKPGVGELPISFLSYGVARKALAIGAGIVVGLAVAYVLSPVVGPKVAIMLGVALGVGTGVALWPHGGATAGSEPSASRDKSTYESPHEVRKTSLLILDSVAQPPWSAVLRWGEDETRVSADNAEAFTRVLLSETTAKVHPGGQVVIQYEEETAWLDRLADELRGRGYTVVHKKVLETE